MVVPLVDEISEPIVEAYEQVIAPVVDMDEDIAMLFGDDDFEDDDSEGFMMRRSRRISTVEGQVRVMASQMVYAANRWEQVGAQVEQGQRTATQRDEVQTMVLEMSSRESTLMQCILWMDRQLADLEREPPRPQ
nr:hypothetical protein [Tanacetum cinerariifolium]